jgi:hypothetical protein
VKTMPMDLSVPLAHRLVAMVKFAQEMASARVLVQGKATASAPVTRVT